MTDAVPVQLPGGSAVLVTRPDDAVIVAAARAVFDARLAEQDAYAAAVDAGHARDRLDSEWQAKKAAMDDAYAALRRLLGA